MDILYFYLAEKNYPATEEKEPIKKGTHFVTHMKVQRSCAKFSLLANKIIAQMIIIFNFLRKFVFIEKILYSFFILYY